MLSDDKNLAVQLAGYVRRLSKDAYAVMEAYNLDDKIARMDRAGILYPVLSDFADLDLRPSEVSNEAMGMVFEELLRKFSEMSNETAGEHYTPREVITLMVDLLLTGKTSAELTENPKPVRTVYDPAAGTGGMLMGALHQIEDRNPAAVVKVYGQELNDETWAIAQSDLMMQDIDPKQMANGNTLTTDAFSTDRFDFVLANPPYGVDWKGYAAPIKDEHEKLGPSGRFGAGLPRVSDGSLLFLQHMLSKMKPTGSRVGIVLSGSPLFSGQAGSGESEIRRWILENDWLEGIVALPDQMFYNTGISTYVWILTNDKAGPDRGRVKLIDGRELGTKMRRSLGDKRKELTPRAIEQLAQLYGGALGEFAADSRVKVLEREAFSFQRITLERPLLDEAGELVLKKGKPTPNSKLRDQENIPLPAGFLDLAEGERGKVLRESAEDLQMSASGMTSPERASRERPAPLTAFTLGGIAPRDDEIGRARLHGADSEELHGLAHAEVPRLGRPIESDGVVAAELDVVRSGSAEVLEHVPPAVDPVDGPVHDGL
jgi:type I restriction enzyme M protein